jgi:hypothetical protein
MSDNTTTSSTTTSGPERLCNTPEFFSDATFDGSYTAPNGTNTLNQIYQPVKVYIEGVEVPYSSISINQTMRGLPTCEMEIPPSPGLMEIIRYYQPKVHVFYTDLDQGGDRLLFWGHLSSAMYSKNRGGSGYNSVRFRCNHRLKLADDILLYFGSHVVGVDTKEEGSSIAMDDLTSTQSIVRAFEGITGPRILAKDKISPYNTNLEQIDLTKLPETVGSFEGRLIGMPGAMVNLWNQLKRAACNNPNLHLNMLAMYIPLFEEGLSYFKRLSGHYLVERYQQDNRKKFCPPEQSTTYDVLVPYMYTSSSQDAAQSFYAISAAKAAIGGDGEMTGFLQLCDAFYDSMLYEMVTLASPAEVALDPTTPLGELSDSLSVVETIIKPSTPFYYAPICNVIFPRMFTAIDIDQDEQAVPTRVSARHDQIPSSGGTLYSYYRGPNSVREAIALGSYFSSDKAGDNRTYDLAITTAADTNVPGVFEQGRGIHPYHINLPWWLVLMIKTYNTNDADGQSFPKADSADYQDMLLRMADWEQRYAYSFDSQGAPQPNPLKKTLNPNSPLSGVQAYQTLLFNSVDYEFTKAVSRARQGTVSCVFNPYIVPGYPMDVLDDSPNCPSFHGMCSSVTHTITATSISTTVGIVAAVSYAELSMYYLPPMHPTLMSQLGMINQTTSVTPEPAYKGAGKGSGETSLPTSTPYADTSGIGNVASTLLQNPDAKAKADEFYWSVLGVGAADPTELYDYQVCQPRPQIRKASGYQLEVMPSLDSLTSPDGGDYNDWNTVPGNLRLVSRNIEGKESIASKFKYTFIDLDPDLYSGEATTYSNPIFISKKFVEPGASIFLTYKDTKEWLKPIPRSTKTSG